MTGTKLRERWQEFMKKPGGRRVVFAVLACLLGAAVVGLCIMCYSKGFNAGRTKQRANTVTQNKKEPKEETQASVTASGQAAESSGAAVSEQAVVSEAAAGNTEEPDSKDQTKPKGNKVNQNTAHEGSAAAPTSSYAGKLSVNGSQLFAGSSPVQLRGVSTHGLSWYPEYVNPAMFAELKAWGANAVRLAMYTAEYNGYCTGGGAL